MSLLRAVAGIVGSKPGPITFSGSFTALGAGPTVTSALITCAVPGGNSGQLAVTDYTEAGAVAFESSVNGAAFVAAEGATVTVADGQTLQFRITGTVLGENAIWSLTDVTNGRVNGPYTLEDTT